MADLKPSSLVVALLGFVVVIVGFYLFIGSFTSSYGVPEEESTAFKNVFDKSSELLDIANTSAKQVAEAGTPQQSYQYSFSLGGWKSAIKVLKDIPSITTDIFKGIAETFGIDPTIFMLISAMIIVGVTFAIIGAVFNRRL